MIDPSGTVGVDRRRKEWLIARVRRDSGRPIIERLQRCHIESPAECDYQRDEPVVLAIPDDQVLVKSMRLGGGGDPNRLAAFRNESGRAGRGIGVCFRFLPNRTGRSHNRHGHTAQRA